MTITVTNDVQRKGDWMQTFTGKAFWPADPHPDEVCIEDIAHALSLLCRYGGHCNRFYSVAEHSVIVSRMVSPGFALDGLMHDAPEAYLVDLPRPAKASLPQYKVMEERIWRAIIRRFPVLYATVPHEVHAADNAILFSERDANMNAPPMAWKIPDPGYRVPLHFWSPKQAERAFLARFRDLTGDTPLTRVKNFFCRHAGSLVVHGYA